MSWPDAFATTSWAAFVPKGHGERLAYVTAFVEEAKADGMVAQFIAREGLRGIEVTPPANTQVERCDRRRSSLVAPRKPSFPIKSFRFETSACAGVYARALRAPEPRLRGRAANIRAEHSVRGEAPPMTMPIALNDITIHPIVEQEGAFFDVMGFFPDLTQRGL